VHDLSLVAPVEHGHLSYVHCIMTTMSIPSHLAGTRDCHSVLT